MPNGIFQSLVSIFVKIGGIILHQYSLGALLFIRWSPAFNDNSIIHLEKLTQRISLKVPKELEHYLDRIESISVSSYGKLTIYQRDRKLFSNFENRALQIFVIETWWRSCMAILTEDLITKLWNVFHNSRSMKVQITDKVV